MVPAHSSPCRMHPQVLWEIDGQLEASRQWCTPGATLVLILVNISINDLDDGPKQTTQFNTGKCLWGGTAPQTNTGSLGLWESRVLPHH